jgi:hypothetical protein
MLKNLWAEVEYLDICRATRGAHIHITQGGSGQKNFQSFHLLWFKPRCLYNEQNLRYKVFFLDTYHLEPGMWGNL